MDPIEEQRNEFRPQNGEAPFDLGEVFYSRTDDRGVIQSGNYVFQRVAHYEWDELLGAPHKTVRHPEMPKGVFRVFWEELKAGKVTAAYVDNRAKDGLNYWVFAIVAPCKGGYLSARVKPTSKLFEPVKALYEEMLAAEGRGTSVDDSAQMMLDALQGMGYANYDAFVVDAVGEELLSECHTLGIEPIGSVTGARELVGLADSIITATERLSTEFTYLGGIPRNLQIKAARVERTDGPLSVLARNYEGMSVDMSEWFEAHVVGENTSFSSIRRTIERAMLVGSVATILARCDCQLLSERRELGGVEISPEREMLGGLQADYKAKSREAYALVATEAGRIVNSCRDMKRMLLGLDTLRVAFKIEDSRSGEANAGIGDIIAQLAAAQDRANTERNTILEDSRRMAELAAEMQEKERAHLPDILLYGPRMLPAVEATPSLKKSAA
ncbi:PAS domain-containing protein [Oceanicola sp. D3]|uniref:PAS domain-containing protein n=1 Tax=Oceanicola sp. D3 TaxID=2587163 RepID=UPI0011236787|nr:PAS domain-containing protein [Oceanicola sp. D3]QDC08099.1 PAS domain-containing protein [Oceanicola sp. D3]